MDRAFAGLRASALFWLAVMPAVAFAQASITGVVKDTSGAVLPGVTVEAASPALIEKVRTAVTDGNGQYRITELRPGGYTVTFTLPGFNTVKRDGITLTGSFTATVDAELRVGALEETITVTGEAPIVDVQSTTRQRVIDQEAISTLPTGRNMFNLGVLVPGVSISTGGLAAQDVGGALGPETRALVAHGGRTEDQRFTMNGVSLSSMIGGGWGGGAIPNATGVQEMVFDTASVVGRPGDRRRAHQLHPARRRQPVPRARCSATSPTTRCRRTTSTTTLLARNPALRQRRHRRQELGLQPRLRRPDQARQASGSSPAAATRAPTSSRRACSSTRTPNNPTQVDLRARSRAARPRSRRPGPTTSCA